MKNIYTCMLVVLVAATANAQFSKGQRLFGPSFSFNINNSERRIEVGNPSNNQIDDIKDNGFGIGIGMIVMKSPTKGRGFAISYAQSFSDREIGINTSTTIMDYKSKNFSTQYFQRKLYDLKKGFYFFHDIGLAIDAATIKTSSLQTSFVTNTETNEYGGLFFVTPGFMYQIKPKFLLEANLNRIASIGYSFEKGKTVEQTGTYRIKGERFIANSALTANQLLNYINFSAKWIL